MRYLRFTIENYRAITQPITIDISKKSLIPLVGINECGKTTILQGIFCFDYINDNEYEGKHLENTLNLYQTKDSQPTITAQVEISWNDLNKYIEIVNESMDSTMLDSNNDASKEINSNMENTNKINLNIKRNKYRGYITIKRYLSTRNYFIEELSEIDEELQNKLAKKIISNLPYVLYNDDFTERPPSIVPIPNKPNANLSGWLAIYERLFKQAGYSLFEVINESDKRRRNSILSDVKNHLNNTLSKAWKTFLLSRNETINVNLEIISNINNKTSEKENQLEITIIEKVQNKERMFNVIDRSKGFLWFFNFVMKLEFNPKIINNKSNTIYLLDEPGSYLHSSAQEKLCKKLKSISEKFGKVIYCTHSHHLLNPEVIPLNNILIVEKNKKKNINLIPITQYKTKNEKITAFQPIFEALIIPAFGFYINDEPIIAVEGIYDKYSIELFINLDFPFKILSGTSADSIIKNISFLIAYGINYIALWDNDGEGRKNLNKARNIFGEYESKRFDMLPSNNGQNRRMEDMYLKSDLDLISEELQLPANSSYERIISTLYYQDKRRKEKIVEKISDKTKQNFEILKKIIIKRFNESKNLVVYGR